LIKIAFSSTVKKILPGCRSFFGTDANTKSDLKSAMDSSLGEISCSVTISSGIMVWIISGFQALSAGSHISILGQINASYPFKISRIVTVPNVTTPTEYIDSVRNSPFYSANPNLKGTLLE